VDLGAVRDPSEDLTLRISRGVDKDRLDIVRAERDGRALDLVFGGGCVEVGHGVHNS
jgi:hypothetical protein